jgi:hypothetical protein
MKNSTITNQSSMCTLCVVPTTQVPGTVLESYPCNKIFETYKYETRNPIRATNRHQRSGTLVRTTWAMVSSTFQPLKAIMNHGISKAYPSVAWIVESQREAVKKYRAIEILPVPWIVVESLGTWFLLQIFAIRSSDSCRWPRTFGRMWNPNALKFRFVTLKNDLLRAHRRELSCCALLDDRCFCSYRYDKILLYNEYYGTVQYCSTMQEKL